MVNSELKHYLFSRVFPDIHTPAQYVGGELNSVVKDHGSVRGTVCLHEGSWYDPATPGVPGALDKQGSVNTLTLDEPLSSRFGQATIAGTALVQAEKYTAMVPPVTAYEQVAAR